jgi:two-component system, chemotaxis family, protein-glutamate methylesterase/glutaminase
MPHIEVVVIGASAGGLQALIDLVGALSDVLDVPILVVVHTKSEGESFLSAILGRRTRIPVLFGEHGAVIAPGRIYIAPPNVHMLISESREIRLNHGPRENGFRPAVDPLFRSAARVYGAATMGVILSGALDDGTYGLKVVKDAGGLAVVQDPNDATFPGMPLSALRYVDVDHVLSAEDIGRLIANPSRSLPPAAMEGEDSMAGKDEPDPQNFAEETDVEEMERAFGAPSGLTCPDCGGALWELKNGELVRYRCHVGHQFTTEGLDAEQQDAVESALWSAVRVLEEHAELRHRMAKRAGDAGMSAVSSGFSESASDSQRQAHTIRELLFSRTLPDPPPPPKTEAVAKRSTNGRGHGANGKAKRARRRSR